LGNARPVPIAYALAAFFVLVQYYTSLEALGRASHYGYPLVGRTGAAVLAACMAASGVACLVTLVRSRVAIARSTFGAVVALWLAATILSALLGFDPAYGLEVASMMLLAAGFGCALVAWYREPGVAAAVAWAYLCAGGLACAAGIAMVLLRIPRGLYASSYGRAAGLFVTANQFAEFLEFFVFVALGFALGARSTKLRALGAVSAVLGVVALGLTFSRECWLGSAVAACFLGFALGKRRLAAVLGAATLVAVAVVATRPLAHHDPSDSFSRLRTLEAGVRVAELFPLTGVGPVQYVRVYPAIAPIDAAPPGTFGALHPHDAYVSLAGELGLVGVGAALWGWLRLGRALTATLRARPANERIVGLGACAALVAGFVSGLFDTIGVVQMTFVWIPYAAFALASADAGLAV
jgi:O-antigen ligase